MGRGVVLGLLVLVALLGLSHGKQSERDLYMQKRQQLVETDAQNRLGAQLTLTPAEEAVDAILKDMKQKEIERTDGWLPVAHNLYKMKPSIAKSPLLPIMKALPKGAVLHGHLEAMYNMRFFVNQTYRDNCYYNPETGQLAIAKPGVLPSQYKLMSEVRAAQPSVYDFDAALYRSMTMTDGEELLGEGEHAWKKFQNTFSVIWQLIWYRPVFEEYLVTVLDELRSENVQHVELRISTGFMFELDRPYTPYEEVAVYRRILNKYKQDHPNFSAKIISTTTRHLDQKPVLDKMMEVLKIRTQYNASDLYVGFDLVGEEDTGHTTLFYLDQIQQIQQLDPDFPFFFHGGETAKTGNTNLFDVILLGSRRIAHGYNIFRYPTLMDLVKEKKIALEICPWSNQVLRLVEDLRDHPAASYIARGLPITINPDDPGVLDYPGVYYDYYAAFMAWDVDIKVLKQLVINSLEYSSLSESEKAFHFQNWNASWNNWVDWVVKNYS